MTIPAPDDSEREAEVRIVVRLDPGETCMGLAALVQDIVHGVSTRRLRMVGLRVTPVVR